MKAELNQYYTTIDKPNALKKIDGTQDENHKLLMYAAFSGLISYLSKHDFRCSSTPKFDSTGS